MTKPATKLGLGIVQGLKKRIGNLGADVAKVDTQQPFEAVQPKEDTTQDQLDGLRRICREIAQTIGLRLTESGCFPDPDFTPTLKQC